MGLSTGATYILLWVLVIIQAILIVTLVHQVSVIRHRIESGDYSSSFSPLPIGSLAPDFSAIDMRSGKRVHSSSFQGKALVLLFLSTDCSVCRNLAHELNQLATDRFGNLVVYCNGAARGCQILLSVLSSTLPVLRKDSENVATAFALSGFPVAVLLDETWKIVGFRYPTRVANVLELLAYDGITHRATDSEKIPELLSLRSQT